MSEGKPTPPELQSLRARIDAIDRQVLELLAKRMRVVEEVAAVKRAHGLPIRDWVREREVFAARARVAEELGLAAAAVESIYRQIMLSSRDHQAALGAGVARVGEPKAIAVIGGRGAMGEVVARLFRDLGHRVEVADLETELTPEVAAAGADVVVVSVPIAVTGEVIARIGPRVRRDALLLDVTSIKREPLDAMLAATVASVAGTHPLFGPGVHTLQGQRVVVCPGRGDAWREWLVRQLEARGLVVTEAGADEHDRAMALVQVLTHFQTQVFGLALTRVGISVAESRRFTSPAYLMELYIAARHFAQDSQLYGPIEMRSPERDAVTGAFCDAAVEIADVLRNQDQARFDRVFEEVRAFFGDFTAEAMEKSSFLIDRLVERELG